MNKRRIIKKLIKKLDYQSAFLLTDSVAFCAGSCAEGIEYYDRDEFTVKSRPLSAFDYTRIPQVYGYNCWTCGDEKDAEYSAFLLRDGNVVFGQPEELYQDARTHTPDRTYAGKPYCDVVAPTDVVAIVTIFERYCTYRDDPSFAGAYIYI